MILSESIRNNDVSARLGGDEFIILYEQCSAEFANNLANNILKKINNATLSWNGNKIHIGASIGVTEFNSDRHDASTLIKHADIACYKSKSKGKNQSTIFKSKLQQYS
jgi:diguanylate cyclase (GGDEF)-like protein